MSDSELPVEGVTISIRVRRDLVVVDPERFLAAAQAACRELNPDVTEAGARDAVANAYDAVYALIDRDWPVAGSIWPELGRVEVGRGAPLPGVRVADRPDGLSPAGILVELKLNEPRRLQDYGCSLPE
ncbi:MAG TPA: hypothetical protein VJ914_08785 [Pseudonocardiaceae bacterium]|nr:hypothetical protein [Pseudonocardiaceae bacterium]